eukprot:scaffold421303_cov50-Prasinocladus_malaysianus.AAC.1
MDTISTIEIQNYLGRELSAARQRLLEWVRRQVAREELIKQVRAGQDRDLMRCCFAGWVIHLEHMRKVKRKQGDRAVLMAHHLLWLKAHDILLGWRQVALGDRSRKVPVGVAMSLASC